MINSSVMPKVIAILLTIVSIGLTVPSQVHARRNPRANTYREPKILTRAQWGADESLGIVFAKEKDGITGGEEINTETRRGRPTQLSEKEKKCRDTLRNNPEDFQVRRTEYDNGNGSFYVWPRRYSPKIKTIVIHHTGENETEETLKLSGRERVRAIYRTHTVSNGWGDIGYHYLIDKKGVIYEGRAGGENVVGAHVYCANVGTIGIALIGNFQWGHPTEEQLSSLRWLLIEQTQKHGLRANGRTVFQGQSMSTIVAHRDLGSTVGPGRTVRKLLPAIRRYTAQRDFTTALLPLIATPRRTVQTTSREAMNTLTPLGETDLKLPPRGVATILLKYKASNHPVQVGASIADVSRTEKTLGLWQRRLGSRIRVRNDIRAERSLREGESAQIQLTVLAPRKAGTYTLQIGNITYTIEATGRRVRSTR